ncbi:MAG: hypothetical protein KC646_14515 [Candidatus Cloacimonetes bacterium]|nr:hypothetical protein [Candidatus Cloacimonadota bacterium]
MRSQHPIHVSSFKLRSDLIEVQILKKHFRLKAIDLKKNRIPFSIRTSVTKVPIQSIKGVVAHRSPCNLKMSLKKLPKGFYTPKTPRANRTRINIPVLKKQGSIEFMVREKNFPSDKKVFLPAIKKKYPLLAVEDIVFYKYFPQVDVAKLVNFKFVEKKLLIQFDFSILKSKLSDLVFFIDRQNKLTRFVAINK